MVCPDQGRFITCVDPVYVPGQYFPNRVRFLVDDGPSRLCSPKSSGHKGQWPVCLFVDGYVLFFGRDLGDYESPEVITRVRKDARELFSIEKARSPQR